MVLVVQGLAGGGHSGELYQARGIGACICLLHAPIVRGTRDDFEKLLRGELPGGCVRGGDLHRVDHVLPGGV